MSALATLRPGQSRTVADDRTARAVLDVLADKDPGVTFVLTLRPDVTPAAIRAARKAGFSHFLNPLLEDATFGIVSGGQYTEIPYVIRQWWSVGYRALNLSAKDRDDDCPF
jgi:hypothetical protein